MTPDSLALLDLIGLRPVVVADLGVEATIVPGLDVVLIDLQALTQYGNDIIDEVLAAAVASAR